MYNYDFFKDFCFQDVLSPVLHDKGLFFAKLENKYPFCDVYYDENENLIFEFALAGFKKEDIKIELDANILIVKGQSFLQNDRDKKDFRLEGIKKSDFSVAYSLPDFYSTSSDVSFEDGILRISFLKDEKAKKKLIEIK
jgi:HSP20 family protein